MDTGILEFVIWTLVFWYRLFQSLHRQRGLELCQALLIDLPADPRARGLCLLYNLFTNQRRCSPTDNNHFYDRPCSHTFESNHYPSRANIQAYYTAWSYAKTHLPSAEPQTLKEKALREFIDNWTCEEFVGFVNDCTEVVDLLEIDPESEVGKRAEEVSLVSHQVSRWSLCNHASSWLALSIRLVSHWRSGSLLFTSIPRCVSWSSSLQQLIQGLQTDTLARTEVLAGRELVFSQMDAWHAG